MFYLLINFPEGPTWEDLFNIIEPHHWFCMYHCYIFCGISNCFVLREFPKNPEWITNSSHGNCMGKIVKIILTVKTMWNEPRHDKTNKMILRPAKTQISLDICPVWSESSLAFFMQTAKTLFRLGGCPGWSESSLGAHSLCWFCHVVAQISNWKVIWVFYLSLLCWYITTAQDDRTFEPHEKQWLVS